MAAMGVLRRKWSRAGIGRDETHRLPGRVVAIGFDGKPAAGPHADKRAVDESQMHLAALLGLDALSHPHGHASHDGAGVTVRVDQVAHADGERQALEDFLAVDGDVQVFDL